MWGKPCLAAVVALLLLPAAALAETTVSTIVIADDAVDLNRVTEVDIGLRRGIRAVDGTRYRFQGELLSQRQMPEELFLATEQLAALEESLRNGYDRRVPTQLDGVINTFEANLDLVSRGNLASAYILKALTWCRRGRQRRCRQGFAYVLGFRDTFNYDTARYPAEYFDLFESTRAALLTDGVRGTLEVQTEPPGAEVFIDGRSIGASPATAEGVLTGSHYVTVKAPGFLEQVSRVTIPEGRPARETITLEEDPSALLVRQNIPGILRELGRPQAGPNIRSIDGYLPVQQVVIAVISPGQASDAFAMYLYDLRTHFLLAHRDASLSGQSIAQATERLTQELYDGVSLDGRVAAPEEPVRDDGEIWEQWWFWTAVGVAVVSGTATAIVLSPSDPDIPDGAVRVQGTVR